MTKKFLIGGFIAAAVYLLAVFLMPLLVVSVIEKELKVKVDGRPTYSLLPNRFTFSEITVLRQGEFRLMMKDALFESSLLGLLFNQVPLELQSKNIELELSYFGFQNSLTETFTVLTAKITFFRKKGLTIHSFSLTGDKVRMAAEGYLAKKGIGNSDLSVDLTAQPEAFNGNLSFLNQNVIRDREAEIPVSQPLNFHFRIQGDIDKPTLQLKSDLVQFTTREKGVLS